MVRKIAWLITGVVMLLGLSTCSKKRSTAPGGGGLPATYTTYSASVQPIWNLQCSGIGCHVSAGVLPGGGLRLDNGVSHSNLVNTASQDFPSLIRVVPNKVDSSYLIDKLEGTQASVGGGGDRMPQIGGFLSATTINVIKAWIQDSARFQ